LATADCFPGYASGVASYLKEHNPKTEFFIVQLCDKIENRSFFSTDSIFENKYLNLTNSFVDGIIAIPSAGVNSYVYNLYMEEDISCSLHSASCFFAASEVIAKNKKYRNRIRNSNNDEKEKEDDFNIETLYMTQTQTQTKKSFLNTFNILCYTTINSTPRLDPPVFDNFINSNEDEEERMSMIPKFKTLGKMAALIGKEKNKKNDACDIL
jgi:hypothetical protein